MSEKTLDGRIVAVGIGNAPDMMKLGYPAREVERVLFAICTALIRAGARVLYAGNLDPDGYTFKIFRHLAKAYAVRHEIPPFIHLLPEPIWRAALFEDVLKMLSESREIADCWLVADGKVGGTLFALEDALAFREKAGGSLRRFAKPDFEQWQKQVTIASPAAAYTAMRVLSGELTDARVIMGGRMGILDRADDRYQGAMPGVAEEALVSLRSNKPLIVLGAFGGAARDVAIALGLLPESARVSRAPQAASYDEAMQQVAGFREKVPAPLLNELREIAELDHAEELAARTLRLLTRSAPAPTAGA